MIKTILVRANSAEADTPAFAAAHTIARMFDAHMAFLHVGIDPVQLWEMTMASIDAGGARVMAGDWLSRVETEAQVQEDEVRRAVEGFCEREQVPIHPKFDPSRMSASWHTEKGREMEWFPAYGREADLIVVGRPAAPTGVLAAALFESGRPLLIPGSGQMTSAPETGVIAWKSTCEAARAVTAATPILEKCKRVVVLSVVEEAENDSGSTDRLVVALRRHGVPVEAEKLRSRTAEAVDLILDAARGLPSPLLVMGGYGHSRLREMIFGGFTNRVIDGADIPVLMAH
jgi:nucleotide-binding universal stress UspA family protein